MLLHMPFEGGSTSGSAGNNGSTKDYSGYYNNGTVVNAIWNRTGGQIGGYYKFDGSGDYVNIGDIEQFEFNGPFTISSWVNIAVISE